MATPRSEEGFQKQFTEIEEKIQFVETSLQEAEAGSSDEEDLLAEKAGLSVDFATLTEKHQEFKQREAEKAQESAKEEEDKPSQEDDKPSQEEEPEAPKKVWPETLYVAARNDIGFMVNPYDHTRIKTDYKKVVVDNWTIAQIEAGFLIVDKD